MARSDGYEVKTSELRWRCDPGALGFETTRDVPCCREIIGQARALDAIRLGLEIPSPGYNIYVSGLTGTGKSTTIQALLRSMQRRKKDLFDLCYVHNFRFPERPLFVRVAAGQGEKLKLKIAEVLETLTEHVPKVLEGDNYVAKQKEVVEGLKTRRNELSTELEKIIAEKGFRLLEVQYGPFTRPVIVPVVDDQPTDIAKLAAAVEAGQFDKDEFERITKDQDALIEKMEDFLKKSRELDREMSERTSKLQIEFVSPIVDTCLKELKDAFENEKLHEFLSELHKYAIRNLEIFTENVEKGDQEDPRKKFVEFEVNLIVDNSHVEDVPVIIETAPRYSNLFGLIERRGDGRGDFRTDLTMIRAGSILQANGGYLVLNLTDIFEEPGAWPHLKRALKYQKVTIQSLESSVLGLTSALKPEAIDIDVKVVLIGDAESYQILYHYDEDFRKIFKVKADFDTVMPNTPDNIRRYGEFVSNLTVEEKLLPFHSSAVASCAEQGAEIAGRQDKLSTRFSDVADIVREANYWAVKAGKEIVDASDVDKAVEQRIRRVNLSEEKIGEMLLDGTILLDIDGEKVGQVNGLAVFDLGDYSFGKPVRITVETSMGRAGIINIEREAEMSGKTYNKGSLILEGYLRRRFAQQRPLAMSASICFEQSYGGVDGDSASSTEIYGILSSLSNLPIRQDLAVTGSVNQKGQVQPIGGVNEKIQGFFDICKAKGLTGRQGVIIPTLNKKDLMLRKDVIRTIEEGQFHIYAISTIDEGIEILTGVRAGKENPEGTFEKGSVYGLVDEKLTKFAEQLKDYLETGDEKEQ